MTVRLFQALARRHHLLPETADAMAKADLRKAETWRVLGHAIESVRLMHGLLLKEFADQLGVKDDRQVAAWIAGRERPQIETVFAAPMFRASLVIALAKQVDGLTTETVITTKVVNR
jgi:hypothetical protein